MAQTKNWINGAFLTKNAKFDIINIDFYPDFLRNLAALPQSENGQRKITISAQKNDPSKWSVYENTFVPKSGMKAAAGNSDDLPF